MTLNSTQLMLRTPKITSPMMTPARPATMVPMPMPTSAKPCCCATSEPVSATSPLAMARPTMRVKFVLVPMARIMLVVAGGQQGEPELSVQQPVEEVLDDDRERRHREDQVPADHREREGVAKRLEDRLHAEKRGVAAPHDAQVDGVEGRHGEDAGEQLRAVVGGVVLPRLEQEMQEPCDQAGAQTRAHAGRGGQERRVAADDQGAGDGGAERQAAVYGQIGEIEHAEREEHAEHHEAVDEPLLESAGDDHLHVRLLPWSGPGPRARPRPLLVYRARGCRGRRACQNFLTALLTRSAGMVTP